MRGTASVVSDVFRLRGCQCSALGTVSLINCSPRLLCSLRGCPVAVPCALWPLSEGLPVAVPAQLFIFWLQCVLHRGAVSGVVGHPPVPPVAMRLGPGGARLGLPDESRWSGEGRWSALEYLTSPNSYSTIQ
jgi:hypothetical protein